jgi:hypothetical protein
MPSFFQALHLPYFEVDHSQKMNRVLELRVINDWIAKFISFFIPIYLFQLGQNLNYPVFFNLQLSSFQKGILLMAGYSALVRMLVLLLSLPLGRLIAQKGTRISLLANLFFQSGYFLFLLFSRKYLGLLALAAIFQAAHIFLLNTIFLTLFSVFTLKKHIGEDLGLSEFLLQLVSVVVPALGGLIIVKFGYDVLFLSALFGILANLIIIFSLDTVTFKNAPNWSEFKSWFFNLQYRRVMLSYVGRYFNDGALGLWPIYVLLFVGSVEKVGFAYSLSLFLSMTIIFFSGMYFDRSKSKKPFMISGGLISIMWILRMSVANIFYAVVIDTVDKLAGSFHWLFFDAMSINRGRGGKALSFFTYRELAISLSGVIFWLLVIALFILPMSWYGLFGLGAVGVILSLLMNDQKHEL